MIETAAEGDVWVITALGKLTGPEAAVRLTRAVEEGLSGGFRKFLVDLARTDWVDSTGIGAIASTSVRVRDGGGSFVLAGVRERVLRILEVTRMDQVIQLEDDRGAGLETLAG